MFVTIVGVRPKNLEDVSARTVGRMKKELPPQLVGRMKKELPPQLVKKELPNQLDAKLLGWMNNLPPK